MFKEKEKEKKKKRKKRKREKKMAVKITFASVAVLFVITTFSTFTGEATISTSPATSPDLSPATSPSSSSSSEITCSTDYASQRMIGIAEETKDFIRKYIKTRLDNKDKLDEKNKECLYKSFNSYEASLGIIEQAINDLTLKRYSNVIMGLRSYQTTVASTLVCAEGADLTTVNPEFKGMKEWTHFNIEDVIKRLKACSSHLSDL